MGAGKGTEDGRQASVVRAITDIYGYRCIIITIGARAAAVHFYHSLRLNVSRYFGSKNILRGQLRECHGISSEEPSSHAGNRPEGERTAGQQSRMRGGRKVVVRRASCSDELEYSWERRPQCHVTAVLSQF